MRESIARKLLVILLLMPMLVTLVACSEEDISILRDIALLWAAENAGSILKWKLGFETGDSEVDAVMEAKGVIDNMKEAEKLMEEGRQEDDIEKMAQAVDKRPGDYTYRVSLAAELMQQGYSSDALDQFDAGYQAAQQYGGAYHAERYTIQAIDELSLAGQTIQQNGFKDKEQCRSYYIQMGRLYGQRFEQTGQAFFQEQQQANLARAEQCQ
jgi:hypothetical protein